MTSWAFDRVLAKAGPEPEGTRCIALVGIRLAAWRLPFERFLVTADLKLDGMRGAVVLRVIMRGAAVEGPAPTFPALFWRLVCMP